MGCGAGRVRGWDRHLTRSAEERTTTAARSSPNYAMERRTFIHTAGRIAAGGALLSQGSLQAATAPQAETRPTPGPGDATVWAAAPVLLNPAPDGVSVICALRKPATGWVEYGETAALGQRCDARAHGFLAYEEKALAFRLEGLRPGTTYFYRMHAVVVEFNASGRRAQRGVASATETRSFRTLDPAAATARFTIWNDTHENKESLRGLAARHRERPGDLLVWNGDVTNDIASEELLLSEYLNPAGQAFAATTPYFLSRGNHDVRGRAARCLPHYLPGPGGQYFYTFRQGPVACVVLDTGEDKPDETPSYAGLNDFATQRRAQRAWLERAIKEPAFASAPFRIACLHIPLVWDDPVPEPWLKVWGGFKGWVCEDGRELWQGLLEQAGVRLVISGHTHKPAWFPPKAGRSFGQLIGGGPAPTQAASIRVEADARELRFAVENLAGEVLLQDVMRA